MCKMRGKVEGAQGACSPKGMFGGRNIGIVPPPPSPFQNSTHTMFSMFAILIPLQVEFSLDRYA